jgi:hypothetical protein
MKPANGQFDGHIWEPQENEYGQKIHTSRTPHGLYTISGHGAGRMKWSVNHEDGWEALGRTRKEVQTEADIDLKNRRES